MDTGNQQRKTSPHGNKRQRLGPQWDGLLNTTTTSTMAEEDRRAGGTKELELRRVLKFKVLDLTCWHTHELRETMATCRSPR